MCGRSNSCPRPTRRGTGDRRGPTWRVESSCASPRPRSRPPIGGNRNQRIDCPEVVLMCNAAGLLDIARRKPLQQQPSQPLSLPSGSIDQRCPPLTPYTPRTAGAALRGTAKLIDLGLGGSQGTAPVLDMLVARHGLRSSMTASASSARRLASQMPTVAGWPRPAVVRPRVSSLSPRRHTAHSVQ